MIGSVAQLAASRQVVRDGQIVKRNDPLEAAIEQATDDAAAEGDDSEDRDE